MDIDEPKVGAFESASRKWQYVLDKLSPHALYRWLLFALFLTFYVVRVWIVNGWYIVTYGLGIYMLNQLIGFLSPQVGFTRSTVSLIYIIYVLQFDPEDENFDSTLPTRNSDEYR